MTYFDIAELNRQFPLSGGGPTLFGGSALLKRLFIFRMPLPNNQIK